MIFLLVNHSNSFYVGFSYSIISEIEQSKMKHSVSSVLVVIASPFFIL